MIEQNYNQIWLLRDKTPKTESRLKYEFGNIGKTLSHLILEAVRHLDHIHLYFETLAHKQICKVEFIQSCVDFIPCQIFL